MGVRGDALILGSVGRVIHKFIASTVLDAVVECNTLVIDKTVHML